MVVQPSCHSRHLRKKVAAKRLTILANLINADGYEHITGVPSGIINGQGSSQTMIQGL